MKPNISLYYSNSEQNLTYFIPDIYHERENSVQ